MKKTIKLITASFFQPENWGNGKKIGITSGKPKQVECDFKFEPFDPGNIYWDYKNGAIDGPEFEKRYREKLEAFCEEIENEALLNKCSVFDCLAFEDGDSLLSWENEGNKTFRKITAEYLRRLGYEVEEK